MPGAITGCQYLNMLASEQPHKLTPALRARLANCNPSTVSALEQDLLPLLAPVAVGSAAEALGGSSAAEGAGGGGAASAAKSAASSAGSTLIKKAAETGAAFSLWESLKNPAIWWRIVEGIIGLVLGYLGLKQFVLAATGGQQIATVKPPAVVPV